MMNCQYCNGPCIKTGFQKNGTQKFRCKTCNKYQQAAYLRKGWAAGINKHISLLLTEGLSLRGIARILKIALSTVISRIKKISSGLFRPLNVRPGSVCEIDELWTFVGSKMNEVWVMYALDRYSKRVLDFDVGSRTKANLKRITDCALWSNPERICTDGLNVYPSLIPEALHRTGSRHTRHIERYNLNLRTHLKRLARKTICFSKSREMLRACLSIYFWGRCGCPS